MIIIIILTTPQVPSFRALFAVVINQTTTGYGRKDIEHEWSPPDKLKQIIRLREQGMGIQTISKGLGVSRNTIKKYLALIKGSGHDIDTLLEKEGAELEVLLASPLPDEEERKLGLEAMRPYIEKELSRVGVSRWLLWTEYMQQNPGGYSYSHFCNHLRRWKAGKDATMHMEHSPGDKMFIDFAVPRWPGKNSTGWTGKRVNYTG